ncbi:putative glutaredoxin-like protein [Dehalogenimonas sp. WBC-2]|nr:putative glutaredoxin-like protein [Dehalogenimonas sp. WBC-2]
MTNPEIITVYGTAWCPDCLRAKRVFESHGINFKWIDLAQDTAAVTYVEKINKGNRSVPTIVFPDGSIMVEPSNAQLENKIAAK